MSASTASCSRPTSRISRTNGPIPGRSSIGSTPTSRKRRNTESGLATPSNSSTSPNPVPSLPRKRVASGGGSGWRASGARAQFSMPGEFRHREHRSDDGDDVDDERTEDQPEDTVEDIRLDRFDLRLEAQFGFADVGAKLRAKLGDVLFGREIGTFGPCLNRRGQGFGR